MWVYVKWVPVQFLLTFLLQTNIGNKPQLTTTLLFGLLFEMHHNTTLNANLLNPVCWCLSCYHWLVACMHFQQSFYYLFCYTYHWFHLDCLLLLTLHFLLNLLPFLWGVHFTFQLFQYIPLFSTAYSSTCIQLSSLHQLSNIILIPNVIVLFPQYLFLRTSVFCKLRLFCYCYICLRFSYKIFFFCTALL